MPATPSKAPLFSPAQLIRAVTGRPARDSDRPEPHWAGPDAITERHVYADTEEDLRRLGRGPAPR